MQSWHRKKCPLSDVADESAELLHWLKSTYGALCVHNCDIESSFSHVTHDMPHLKTATMEMLNARMRRKIATDALASIPRRQPRFHRSSATKSAPRMEKIVM
jgi:hypothetical protein